VTERAQPSREWRRLLVDPARLAGSGGRLNLEPAETHYLRRVLRLRAGERLALVDGCGGLWSARLEEAAPGRVGGVAVLEQPLAAPLQRQPPPSPAIALAVALPRLDADVLLRMACELGVDRVVSLRAERSVPNARLKPGRGEAILREAVEQCERLWLPVLEPERQAAAWLAGDGIRPSEAGGPAPDPAGEEPVAGEPLKLLTTTRRHGLPSLAECLAGVHRHGPVSVVWVAVGPEGGWSPAEEASAEGAGWHAVNLGETILRTSTAAVAAAAQLAEWRRRSGL
jgi:16S rRNA (uracil1498-N3)-methyltransferase